MARKKEPDRPANYGRVAGTAKLLSDQSRLKILDLLRGGPRNVTELCEAMGQGQPAISHHLALMRVAGLVDTKREAKFIFYSITADARAVLDAMFAHTPA